MPSLLRRRPTYSGVTSTLALALALGGGAWAATALPKNSVGEKQLKKNAVVASKIKKNAVGSSEVKDGSLTGSDLKLSSLGTVPSATTATNATHAASASALDRVIVRTAAGTTSGPTAAATANCDAGYWPVNGGAKVADEQNAYIVDSYPVVEGYTVRRPELAGSWTAHVRTAGAQPSGFTVFVICAPVGSVDWRWPPP